MRYTTARNNQHTENIQTLHYQIMNALRAMYPENEGITNPGSQLVKNSRVSMCSDAPIHMYITKIRPKCK